MTIYEFILALSFWQWIGVIVLFYLPAQLFHNILEIINNKTKASVINKKEHTK